ncbi:hypothetical protein KDH_76640 [Dictyobacter sp. S3.2.2.5]|uniref:Uncharacterized protein n=1 Tax=Dictyobacter halimunensis TaxID=3026934 RepID=A0ABQ6G5J7_9CHLR|nr:hypothetical protein KDH_76640 [Dictyobacter sp. S3.2.2.5]
MSLTGEMASLGERDCPGMWAASYREEQYILKLNVLPARIAPTRVLAMRMNWWGCMLEMLVECLT